MMQRPVPAGGGSDGSGEIMLFGVRVKVDPMRKCVSMNNLSQYHQPNNNNNNNNNDLKNYNNNNKTTAAASATGYGSADDVVHRHSVAGRERKRGVPWTEEEHKLFLLGLQNVGKGDWRGISRNFVKTRSPTQVASHAQKYFLRKTNLNRRRRRSSLFDITTDSVTATPMEEDHGHQHNLPQQAPETPNISVALYPVSVGSAVNPIAGFSGQVNNASSMPLGSVPAPFLDSPAPSTAVQYSQTLTRDDPTLSLNLSLSFNHHNQLSSRQYQAAPSLSNGDGMISVV
ncbi:GAMYB transcription factor [Heracleum sosnowskyi]|uniref:GAMYB transcription factor n=1 Tax=Heracleum sosnowskyi TaxID=360622 RepID=A0AAD8HV03_9APIA|nr:GAMYB transcription factor [Heracleum sosnowskyi]